jgi:hypothetical protein
MSLLKDGFDLFMAPEAYLNDGKLNCYVILSAVHITTGKHVDYYGKTEAGQGHAELHALSKFLTKIRYNPIEFGNYHLQIYCKDKSCCKYCSAVMGLLGIHPGHDTYKAWESMGVSYAISPFIRKFISQILGVPADRVVNELQQH